MSQVHGEIIHVKFDGQMNVPSSTRNNTHKLCTSILSCAQVWVPE